MDTRELQMDEWINNIRNRHLFKAAVNLSTVRWSCLHILKRDENDPAAGTLGWYEMNLVNDALSALQQVAGGWEAFPFPSLAQGDLRELSPLPSTVYAYASLLLNFIQRNLSTLDK